jgi:hypothetical protein
VGKDSGLINLGEVEVFKAKELIDSAFSKLVAAINDLNDAVKIYQAYPDEDTHKLFLRKLGDAYDNVNDTIRMIRRSLKIMEKYLR